MTEAEIRVMRPQAKDTCSPLSWKRQEGSSSRASGGNMALPTPVLQTLPPELGGNRFLLF